MLRKWLESPVAANLIAALALVGAAWAVLESRRATSNSEMLSFYDRKGEILASAATVKEKNREMADDGEAFLRMHEADLLPMDVRSLKKAISSYRDQNRSITDLTKAVNDLKHSNLTAIADFRAVLEPLKAETEIHLSRHERAKQEMLDRAKAAKQLAPEEYQKLLLK